jgi:hypothetical protein
MSRRYTYDTFTYREFMQALETLAWETHDFERVTGTTQSLINAWRRDPADDRHKAIPPWVPVFLGAMMVPEAVQIARRITAHRLREDANRPGEVYPFMRKR